MGLAAAKGALITDLPDGPAKTSGLLAGDVILTFNGNEIKDVRDLTRTVADSPIGEAVPVEIQRGGEAKTISVTLGRRETDEATDVKPAADKQAIEPKEVQLLGLTLVPVTDQVAKDLNMPAGSEGLAVTHVEVTSEAMTKGVAAGDVIVEAGQKKVVSVKDLQDRVQEAKDAGRKSILLLIRRQGDPRFVALSVE